MVAIKDKSDNLVTMQILSDVQKFCLILGSIELDEKKLLKEYRVFLDILYKYSNLFEVEEGLLYCPECGRWYPIGSAVETIPELMPDDLRDMERDLKWFKKWKTQVPKKILEDGKPYTIK
jgi:uncharacterized protein YbaR (Trm112 family)